MEEKEYLRLIKELNLWGDKELNRPLFGEDCLWKNALQGCIWEFDKGYNKDLEHGYGRVNTVYVDFIKEHGENIPYLYRKNEYSDIEEVMTIGELKKTAKSMQQKRDAYLKQLSDSFEDKTSDEMLAVLTGPNKFDIHRIPVAFPPQDFVYDDETWENFYKEQFTKHSAKEGTSLDLSKYKKSIYPYSSYLGFWEHY